MKVLMIGPARSVHGGVSAVVNNLYAAGLGQKVKLTYIGTMVDGSKVRKLFQAAWAYLVFLTRIPFADILHVNMASDASYYRKKVFVDTAAALKKAIVIHEHGGDFRDFYYERSDEKQKASIQKTLNKAKKFIVLSKEWYEFFSPIVEKDKLLIMENGIIIPECPERKYQDYNLLFLGRLCEQKGIRELIGAVDKLQQKMPDVHLYLGGIWEHENLKKLIEGKEGYITYLGWVGGREKQEYFEKCSYFVLPSYFEGQPISLLEAMAREMCVAAAEVGGIPQMVRDGVQGVLFPAKNEDALEQALFEVLTDKEKAKSYGKAAGRRVLEHYNVQRCVEELAELYQAVYSGEN